MPLATRVSKLTTLSAHINGIVNVVPIRSKFVFKGETFAFARFSPIVSCHHGLNSDTMITTIVVTPPARPNQFILACMFFTHLRYWNVRNLNVLIRLDIDSIDVNNESHQLDVNALCSCVGSLKVIYGILCPSSKDSYCRSFARADVDWIVEGGMT